jgi:carboxypeptidase D
MYDYLREQAHICKFDLNLTYPQTGGKLPYIPFTKGVMNHTVPQLNSRALSPSEDFLAELHGRWLALPEEEREPEEMGWGHGRWIALLEEPEEIDRGRREWIRETFGEPEDVAGDAKSKPTSASSASASRNKSKKSSKKKSSKTSKTATLTTAPNKFPGIPPFNTTLTGKMNPFWGCELLDTVMVYALNLTYPWSTSLSIWPFDARVLASSHRPTRARFRLL